MTQGFTKYDSFRRAIIAAVGVLILFIVGFSTWKALVEYRLTIRAAELQSHGYARALKEHADRAFGEADNILLETINHIKTHGGIQKQSNLDLINFLQRYPRHLPQIGSIFLVDKNGQALANTLNANLQQTSMADREYFRHHRDNPQDNAPFLSRPVKSRASNKWRFYLSRAIHSADGSFEGLVAVGFAMEYFQNFYASLDMGKKGRIVIIRKDGVMLLSQPFKESDLSADFTKSHLFRSYLPKSPSGTFLIPEGKALLESKGRIISYESLESFPVIVNANMGTDEVTASWRESTYKQAILTLAACLALIVLTVLLLRQLKRIEQSYYLQLEQQVEISAAEERYRMLVDNLPVVTWQADEQGKTHYISQVVTKVEGYTPQEIYAESGSHWLERVHPDDLPAVSKAYQALMTKGANYDIQYRIRHKEGHWIWLHDTAFATSLQNGVKVAHGVFSDITKRKLAEDERDQMEIQLRQAQKMEAVGHLAGGVAHDFNNLLTPIMGYAEMACAKLSDNDPLHARLAGILAAAHKAKDLTQQLLSFGRRQPIDSEVLDLNEVILAFNGIIRRTIRESIRIDLVLDPEGTYIKADKSQIEQIILNMTVNAQDALSGNHGRIVIETCRIRMEGESARLHPGMLPGEYVLLAFRDNGCGMSDEVMCHIFEPFFTTKQVGHGTGLGLATIYGIVKQHDAHISVTSHEGEGTVFNIYFPCCDQVPLLQPQVTKQQRHLNIGEATILVVEDNDMVRELVLNMLEGYGYKVLTACDPHSAVALLSDSSESIDLLISDVVMPGMNGPELYEQLVVQLPSLKVIYISGYPINPSLRGGILEDAVNYLQKPFTSEALLERIRQVL